MRRWPDVLPVPSIGYSLSPVDPSRRTDMEVGAPRVRAITKANNDLVDMAWVMTDPEFRAFRAWFADEGWSIGGDSESLAGWSVVGMTRTAGMALSPDLVSVDVLTEDTSGALHYAQQALTGAIAGGTVLVRATLKSDGRDVARLSFFDRAGVARYTNIDLATGVLGDTSGLVTRAVETRGDGWWRVTLTADVGTGGSTPAMRVQSLASGATNYTGDGLSTLSVCEVGADGDRRRSAPAHRCRWPGPWRRQGCGVGVDAGGDRQRPDLCRVPVSHDVQGAGAGWIELAHHGAGRGAQCLIPRCLRRWQRPMPRPRWIR